MVAGDVRRQHESKFFSGTVDGASVVVDSSYFAPRAPKQSRTCSTTHLHYFMRCTSASHIPPYIRVAKDPDKVLFVPSSCVWFRYTSRWTKLNELEAEVGRTEALYAAVTEEGRVAEEEGSSLTAVRTRLEREMVQIGAGRNAV